MKETEWFPPEIKPVRKGVYKTRIYWRYKFSYWNGKYWGQSVVIPHHADKHPNTKKSPVQNKYWIGLKEKP